VARVDPGASSIGPTGVEGEIEAVRERRAGREVHGRGRPRVPRAPRTRRDGGERADEGRRAGRPCGPTGGEGSAAALAGHGVRSDVAIGSAALQASESAERRAWTGGARGMRKRIVTL
jgi:hypothetical protein